MKASKNPKKSSLSLKDSPKSNSPSTLSLERIPLPLKTKMQFLSTNIILTLR